MSKRVRFVTNNDAVKIVALAAFVIALALVGSLRQERAATVAVKPARIDERLAASSAFIDVDLDAIEHIAAPPPAGEHADAD